MTKSFNYKATIEVNSNQRVRDQKFSSGIKRTLNSSSMVISLCVFSAYRMTAREQQIDEENMMKLQLPFICLMLLPAMDISG